MDESAATRSEAAPRLRRSRSHVAAMIVGALLVFAAHFRPWEFAFLEEWPLAEYWVATGPVEFFRHYAEWSLSRPLHLVPTGLGLLLSGGALWGVWVVLGLVAVGQFLTVLWALKPVSRSFWLNAGVALLISLHPLWAGGFLQRFLPAQAAALGMLLAVGLLIRWMLGGRLLSLVLGAVALAAGLLVYPGPAAAGLLVAVVVALAVRATWLRRATGVGVIVLATGLVTLYSLVITRVVAPGAASYEAGNFTADATGTPSLILELIVRSLRGEGRILTIAIAAIVLMAIILGITRALRPAGAVVIAAAAVVSPLCAVVYFGNVAWLYDVDRVGYATSLGLCAALLAWPIVAERRFVVHHVLAAVAAAAAVTGAILGVSKWQPYISLQHQLFEEIAPAMREAEGDEIVVVVDHSATYGTEYTLPQYYIRSAAHIMNADNTPVWLCSLPEDPPLAAAPVCDPADTGVDPRLVHTFAVPNGQVDVYIGAPASDG